METTDARSQLIPDRFKQPFNLIWLWVVPQLLLLLLNARAWSLAIGEMTAPQRVQASWIAGCELALLLTGLAVVVTLRVLKRPVCHGVCIGGLLLQAGYLWLFVVRFGEAWPAAVAPWMLPETELIFYQFALVMPALFYFALRLACFDLPLRRGTDAALSLGGLILIPAAWYLLFHLGRLLSPRWCDRFPEMLAVVFFVGSTVLAMMAFLRLMLLLYGVLQQRRWSRFALPLAAGLLAPLGGLLLNRKIPFPCDFQSPGVYVLTAINGLVLLLPSPASSAKASALWLLRSVLYAFSLYFFVVFLPFLPLSLLAMLACGAGFLILAPTLLFVIHTRQILAEGLNVAVRWGRFRAILAFALCLSFIPLIFTLQAVADKVALRQALDVAFSPDFRAEHAGLNRTAARRALQHLRDMKDGITLPFLSDYYNALVFNNMVLTDEKMQTLYLMFFGEAAPQPTKNERWSLFLSPRSAARARGGARGIEPPRQVELQEVTLDESATNDLIKSTVTLSMQNHGPANSEFTTEIEIPEGVLVTGYWLDCQGRRKPGRLVEKKTAQWVYHMIRDFTRRDPGLLVFKDDTHLKLSVYPFSVNETRASGIEFLFPRGLHPRFRIGMREVTLGTADTTVTTEPLVAATPDGRVHVVLSDVAARQLPTVTRVPYLHFIVDRSANATNACAALALAVERLAREAPDQSVPCRVTFANYEWLDASRDPVPLAMVQRTITEFNAETLPAQGSFCYDRAIARCLLQQQEQGDVTTGSVLRVPVFVVVPVKGSPTVSSVNLAPFRRLVPDVPAYYLARETGLRRIPFEGGTSQDVDRVESPRPVLAFASEDRIAVCRPDGSMCQITLPGTADSLSYYDPAVAAFSPLRGVRLLEKTAYVKGLALWDDYRATRWDPSTLDTALSGIIEQGRVTGVLTPLTAYMVVENTAQEKILNRKEKQALGASHALDFEEKQATQVSPEPSLLWLAPVALLLLVRRRRSLLSQ